jgi:cysteinyl-tRNA synthetase
MALVKTVDLAKLTMACEEKRAQVGAKAAKKAKPKKQQKLERGSVPPGQPIKPPNVSEGAHDSWDDEGVPLTDSEGKELRKIHTTKVQIELVPLAQRKLPLMTTPPLFQSDSSFQARYSL